MSSNPTIVLVHGAFADSSSWSDVIPQLWSRGFDVVAAPNLLRDVNGDAEYVSSIVRAVDGPVVLVGHSYGGVVITRAAQQLPNVKGLVYIAAYQPDTGENAFGLSGATALGAETSTVLTHAGEPELRVNADSFGDVIAGDVASERVRLSATIQRPVTQKALTADLEGEPAWRTLPSWALIATQDNAIPLKEQEFMAARAGSHIVRVDASHAVATSRPEAVADIIAEAARAVS
ncbi:alpha/beta hydrolase [Gordonia desulfuricans]|uniref:Alpha/beta hydrolase n=1 Tax=Gordonia desulfuricans TaxID=89051 RepID=A0A7K3LVW3_9ACTN|nr:alpha/beta hydrolase [Gordonia desulfuricans]NDK92236.1 alpha/beta hydrolase [Gordonia desulfuricans]